MRRRASANSWTTPSSNAHSQRAFAVTTTVKPSTSNGSVLIVCGSPAEKTVGRLTMPPALGWKDGLASGR